MVRLLSRWFHAASIWHVGILLTVIVFIGRYPSINPIHNPLNDGGIFLPVIEELRKRPFPLPETMGYNGANIPFAYPPFGMYAAAALARASSIPPLAIFTLMPFTLSLFCIFLYFLLTFLLTKSRTVAAFSTLLIAIIPESFVWIIMGGGITRAWGAFFALLSLIGIVLWSKNHSLRAYLLSGISFGLSLLSHPDSSVFAAYSLIILGLSTSRLPFFVRLLAAGGTIGIGAALATPWVLTVIGSHGFAPFQAALAIREDSGYPIENLTWLFHNDVQYRVILLLAIVGSVLSLKEKKHRHILLWFIAVLIIRATSMISFDIFPLAILAGIGLTKITHAFKKPTYAMLYYGISIACILLSFLWTNAVITEQFPRLRDEDKEAFEWVRKYTPPSSTFLIISPYTDWWRDNVPEWFPALTGRRSILTVQGTEWLPGWETKRTVNLHLAIRQCNKKTITCIEEAATQAGVSFTHLYLSKMPNQPGAGDYCPLLFQSIRDSSTYKVIYGNNGAEIWENTTRTTDS